MLLCFVQQELRRAPSKPWASGKRFLKRINLQYFHSDVLFFTISDNIIDLTLFETKATQIDYIPIVSPSEE
jgi:hypothetical protein